MCTPFLLFWALLVQSDAPPVSFEVASVKPAPAPINTKDVSTAGYNAGMRAALADQGVRIVGLRVMATDHTLRDLIRYAYEVNEYQISAPEWMALEKYEIAAVMPAGSKKEQAPAMFRTLLVERFHLALHREKKKMPVYALVPVKGGAKLAPPTGTRTWVAWAGSPASGRLHATNAPLSALANQLSKAADRPVVDMTGISGMFDFNLIYTPDPMLEASESGVSLATALQEQLGLRLEKREVEVELLVIERADKVPVGN